jgi:3-isopropylmalate dehydratase small subunit
LRNSIARAIPIFLAPGILDLVEDGETLRVDYAGSHVVNVKTNKQLKIRKFPPMIEKIFEIGGLPEFAYARFQKENPGSNV